MYSHTKITGSLMLLLSWGAIPEALADYSDYDGGLFTGSHLDSTLKNVWMLNTTDSMSDQGIGNQSAWAQGLHLDWQSGWLGDRVGVDASWYGVAKLYANDAFYGRDLLRDKNGKAQGFHKLGQLYAKARWGDAQRHLSLWAGWRQLYKFAALNVTRSRAAPSTWEGVSSELKWDSMGIKAAVVNRFSERDEPEKRRFRTLKSNKQIDYIATGEMSWTPVKGSKISYIAAESASYLLRHGVEASAMMPLGEELNLLAKSTYYYARGLSEWEGARGFSRTAQHLFALVGYQYGRSESGIGWSHTRASLDNGLGHFYWHFGKNTRGAFNSKADGEGNDYINDGEQMVYLYSQYQLLPELLIGLYGNYGFGMKYKNVALKEWECGGYFLWNSPQIKGLDVFAGFGPSYSWKLTSSKMPALDENNSSFRRAKGVGGTVRVEYRFNLF